MAVFGATGTTGAELSTILQQHPACVIKHATSRSRAGGVLCDVEPSAPAVPLVHPDDVALDDVDVAFVCLPHGEAAAISERCVSAGVPTIDLSGDFRLRDGEVHGRVYGTQRSSELAELAVYGFTEVARASIAGAKLVSNPGCYPTCAGLALYPLARAGLLPRTIVINALSGISGAGRKATDKTHFCAVADDVRPYLLGRSHRHTAEIEQLLARLGAPRQVIFNPHVVPLERGMLVTITLDVPTATTEAIHERYVDAYDGEPLVEVLPLGEPARIRRVIRTSRAAVGIHPVADTRSVVITAAIDNLRKGAASQAVQNMNLLVGHPETMGLPS